MKGYIFKGLHQKIYMALEFEAAKLLKEASDQGALFDKCLTIGRQKFMLSKKEVKNLGLSFNKLNLKEMNNYSEGFFRALGAKEIDSLDFSKYEGASLVGDLNKPVKGLDSKFNLIFDGGSLEHIFNFQIAINNYIKMLKVGGRFIGHLPVNNQIGHGFFQFSPELFLRVFSKENGFVIEKAIVIEYGPRIKWFKVIDPYFSGETSHTINKYPLYIYIQAKKEKEVNSFKEFPSQYIYNSSFWNKKKDFSSKNDSKLKYFFSNIKKNLSDFAPKLTKRIDNLYHSSLNSRYSLRNKKLFKRIK